MGPARDIAALARRRRRRREQKQRRRKRRRRGRSTRPRGLLLWLPSSSFDIIILLALPASGQRTPPAAPLVGLCEARRPAARRAARDSVEFQLSIFRPGGLRGAARRRPLRGRFRNLRLGASGGRGGAGAAAAPAPEGAADRFHALLFFFFVFFFFFFFFSFASCFFSFGEPCDASPSGARGPLLAARDDARRRGRVCAPPRGRGL